MIDRPPRSWGDEVNAEKLALEPQHQVECPVRQDTFTAEALKGCETTVQNLYSERVDLAHFQLLWNILCNVQSGIMITLCKFSHVHGFESKYMYQGCIMAHAACLRYSLFIVPGILPHHLGDCSSGLSGQTYIQSVIQEIAKE